MSNEIITTATMVVWANDTLGSGPIVHPMTDGLRQPGLASVRVSVELDHAVDDGELTVICVYQTSQDGFTWSGPENLGSAQVGSGTSFGGTFQALDAAGQALVRFGVKAYNQTTTDLNLGYATLRLELQRC